MKLVGMRRSKKFLGILALTSGVAVFLVIYVFRFDQRYGTSRMQVVNESGAVTRIIPQIVVGSLDQGAHRYVTVIHIFNHNPKEVTMSAEFFNPDGSASALSLNTQSRSARSQSFTHSLLPQALSANAKLDIVGEPDKLSAGLSTVWARITSSATLNIMTSFEVRTGERDLVMSRTIVPSSPADMSKFLIPRVRNVSKGLDIGFALVNAGSTSAVLKATLRNAAGETIRTRELTVPAQHHIAYLTQEFFGNETPGSDDHRTQNSYESILFESTSPQFAAVALAIEGGMQSSVPVDIVE